MRFECVACQVAVCVRACVCVCPKIRVPRDLFAPRGDPPGALHRLGPAAAPARHLAHLSERPREIGEDASAAQQLVADARRRRVAGVRVGAENNVPHEKGLAVVAVRLTDEPRVVVTVALRSVEDSVEDATARADVGVRQLADCVEEDRVPKESGRRTEAGEED